MADTNPVVLTPPTALGPLGEKLWQGYAFAHNFLRQPAMVRALPAIAVTLVILIGLLSMFLLREPALVQLFPSLGEEDKAVVMQTLEAQNIKAKLDQSTGQVMVGRTDLYRAKMLLAAAGLPKTAQTGYAMLTQLPMGASRAVEQIKLKQVQENELSRSIMEIRDIEGVRVHLALPERSAFVRDQSPPTASVFVKLASGRSLSSGQVNAITHLVSSSVPYLPVDNVTVVDQFGTLLTNPHRDADFAMSTQQLEYKARVEKILRERVSNLLTPIIGIGNFNAEINADIDFTRTEQTNETYDPKMNAMRSQQETVQESTDGKARGVPGATANQPPNTAGLTATPPGDAAGGDAAKSRSSSTIKNYEVSREVKSTKIASGDIKRLTLAVSVRSGKTVDENGQTIEKPMSDAERERLTQLMQEAIGFVAERGDKVTLVSSTFADEQKFDTRTWYDAPWLEDAIKQLVIVLILGIVVMGALRPFLNRLLDRSMASSIAMDQPVVGEGESIEVREGESLEEIKARLKPKKAAISAELLDTANTYDDKVTLIRMLVGDDAARVTAVLKQFIQRDLA